MEKGRKGKIEAEESSWRGYIEKPLAAQCFIIKTRQKREMDLPSIFHNISFAPVVNNLGTIIGGTIIALAPFVAKWWEKKSKIIFNSFNENVQTRMKIKNVMQEILIRFQAQRVAIFNYHNGDYSRSGFPFDYVSIVYEEVDQNTAAAMPNFQKLPISMFTNLLDRLVKCEKTDGHTHEELSSSTGDTRQQLIAYGTDTMYHFLQSNYAKDGVVSIAFARPHKLTDEEIEWTRFKVKELYRLQNSLK
jgi:hypothetical protein